MYYESIIEFLCTFITDLRNASAYAFILFLILVSLYFLFMCLKYTIRLNTECHYCMKKSKVILAHRNSWNCVHCDQYNGFDVNGDLNRDIHSHHVEKSNNFLFCLPKHNIKYERNRLCSECNQKQERKVSILSQFCNQEDANYESELRDLKKNLEDIYSLCSDCERLVNSLGLGRPNSGSSYNDINSLFNKSLHSVEDVFNKSYHSNSVQQYLKPALRLLLFLVIHSFLLGILYELYTQSESAFIFKHNEHLSIGVKDRFYKRFYLPFVIVVQLLYLAMDYFQFTRSSLLNWFTFGLFVSLLSLDFDMNYLRLKNDHLVYYQQATLVGYTVVILLNLCLIFLYWLKENRFNLINLPAMLRFRKSKPPQRIRRKSFDYTAPDVEMEDLGLDDKHSPKETTFSRFPFQMNGTQSQKTQAFWATQIQSNGNSQVLNHYGFYQSDPQPVGDTVNSKLKRYVFYTLSFFVTPCAFVSLMAYMFMHVSINFYNDSNLFELRLQFVKSY